MGVERFNSLEGETVVVMASGPSLTDDDARYVLSSGAYTMVINTTYKMAPWADALYTNDDDWLDHYLPKLGSSFKGEVWCGHPDYADVSGVLHVPFDRDAVGLNCKPGHISWGMNSGGAAISLAHKLGAKRIILLGYDQSWDGDKPRWHGRHPDHLQNNRPGFHRWATWFSQAAADAESLGLDIINCSRRTSLECFKKAKLRTVL